MKKNLIPMIMLIIVICIVLIITILIMIRNNIIINNDENHTEYDKMFNVTDRDDYYMVKTILNKYFNAINFLDSNLNDIGVIYQTEEERKELAKEYTSKGIQQLQQMLDKEVIESLELNENNIKEEFLQYKSLNYSIKKMYYIQKNINTNLYFVKGMLNYEKDFSLIVKIDLYTGTFSIYPTQYIEMKGYDENSIQSEFDIEGIKYIEKNNYNTYTKNIITDLTMAQYYLYDYGYLVSNYPEKAYEMLDEVYKNKRFATYEDYSNYIKQSNKRYDLLKLKDYSVEKTDKYVIFTCIDQYGDIYIFKDLDVMSYKVQLDNYTLKDDEYYNKLNNEDKVKYNIKKFVNMINMQDYESAYNLLDENYKKAYFTNLTSFRSYINKNLYNHNKVIFKAYSNDIEPVYVINTSIKNVENEEQSKEIKFLVKLLEGTDFIMSFEV